ncbi:MAG: 5-formyltetrahydrofolate cyclo-ligase [Rhodobacteraceae bacterium]|nr:5-formyltetrahydrofolate cyclo-ligase [Paracoccaceae bacterium]MBR29319.1 5-formyltetrahydrofolate cyclo-ligase [Paracoccaceae bacterium]
MTSAPLPLAAAKADARRAAFARRREAHAALGPAPAPATGTLIQAIRDALPEGGVVSGFLPIRTEIDPRPAMAALHAEGVRICVPVVRGEGLALAFREWTPDAALEAGPFGAQVPAAGAWLTPEAVIAPLVAYDDARMRLGYGGGFYDRTLAALAEAAGAPVPAIGFAFSAQRSTVPLPSEATDRPLDRVVTELG